MLYIIIAVLCSVCVSILLKVLRTQRLDIRQTIVAGYPVAFLLTWFLLKPDVTQTGELTLHAWLIIALLGVLLPLVFVILGLAIDSVGIIATDAAQRLSLIIPIVAAFIVFGEALTNQRLLGIALGFLALFALLYQKSTASQSPALSENANLTTPTLQSAKPKAPKPKTPKSAPPVALWLLGVWLGYGVIDILFKQVAKQGTAFALTLLLSFGLAGLLLLIYLLVVRVQWQSKAVMAGLLLGVLNMGNIYAYVRAHQTLADSPSIVFTGMNVGVIAVASIAGVVLFNERLNKVNIIGLILAVGCVLVLFA